MTPTLTTHAAHVYKSSHGLGLLVYINGALLSTARVALKVNIATLEFARRLPIDQLGYVDACLGNAFAKSENCVHVSWAKVDDGVEQI